MAISRIDIDAFISLDFKYTVLDVRSEGEYINAHIPGALSVPLFNNEQRKKIGTAYKQESKQIAIKIGLEAFGTKMISIVETVEKILDNHEENKTVVVHCWRGGMRSSAVAWLLDLYGYKVFILIGGYKAYRNWGIQQLEKEYPINILGGYTGSGKTYLLQALQHHNQITIDLEEIAKHKGSAFGNIGMPSQPSQEMFENLLSLAFWKASLQIKASQKPLAIWLEDESQRIGLVNIPSKLFSLMRKCPVYFLDIPFEERLKHIVDGYGKAVKEDLINATTRIQKRLGGVETKNTVNFILEDNLSGAFSILLKYYDKQYKKGLHNRENLQQLLNNIVCNTVNPSANAIAVIQKEIQFENVRYN